MSSKVPALLSPYVQNLPEESLTLLTSVLSASTNWLILRFLYAALKETTQRQNALGQTPPKQTNVASNEQPSASTRVVLVSWMRDIQFWKNEARRVLGLDLAKLEQNNRFAFVDGLTNLFSLSTGPAASDQPPNAVPSTAPGKSILPPRSSGPSISNTSATLRATPQASKAATAPTHPSPQRQTAAVQTLRPYVLSSPILDDLTCTILAAASSLASNDENSQNHDAKTLLILDTPSILLQTTTPPITSTDLNDALLELRAHFHATIISVPADGPLVATARPADETGDVVGNSAATPLELENAAFVAGLAHQARCVLGCRMLKTGFAEDVSGVVRATRGGAADDDFESGGDEVTGEGTAEEGEWLYFVGGDGGVKVWARGGSDVGR